MLATLRPAVSPAQLRAARRLERILRNARLAQASNPRNAGLAAGVTVTDNGATLPAVVAAGTIQAITGSGNPGIWTVRGGTPAQIGSHYRMTAAKVGTTGGNLGLGDGRNGTSWRASAMADARYVAFRLAPTTVPYRFLVDGKYVSAAGTLLATTTGTTSQYVLLDLGSRGLRKLTLEGQMNCGFIGAYCEATGALFPATTADEVNAGWLGDSYVYGSAATLLGDGVASTAGDWLGMAMLASGSGGTGWVADNAGAGYRFDQRIANGDLAIANGDLAFGLAAPDVLLFMASVNDRALASATITANALAGLRAARAQYPAVPMVVFGCAPAAFGSAVAASETAVQAAVTALADPLCAFVPVYGDAAGPWIGGSGYIGATTGTGNSDWATYSDGTHPSDEGAAYLGYRYARAALKALTAMYAALV